jgi:hypothetical protein
MSHREESAFGHPVSRRQLLQRGALAGLAAALAQLPGLLGADGLSGTAEAQSDALTVDTFNGLMAFLAPGNDQYSTSQGQSTGRPGGVGANVVTTFIEDLDGFVPAFVFGGVGTTVPASRGVASMLNSYATQVNPVATAQPSALLSPFARLSFADKARVFQRMESDLEGQPTELAFVAGILPGFATFVTFSEAGAFDPSTQRLTGTPVGWQLTNYAGPSDGWPEFRGYYQGRRKVKGAGPNATEVPR